MALIKCKECGKEINDKAKKCIYCGCDYSETKDYTYIIIMCVVISIAAIIIFTVASPKSITQSIEENGIYTNEYDKNRGAFIAYRFSHGHVYRTTLLDEEDMIGTYTINGETINITTNDDEIIDDFYCKILNYKKIKCYCDNKRYGDCINNEYTYIGKGD